MSGLNTKVVDVAAGDNFSIVCTENGEVWTWGEGSGGKLGHGDQKDQREPVLVTGINPSSPPISTSYLCIFTYDYCRIKRKAYYTRGCR